AIGGRRAVRRIEERGARLGGAAGEKFTEIGRTDVTRPRRTVADVVRRLPRGANLPSGDASRGRVSGRTKCRVKVEALGPAGLVHQRHHGLNEAFGHAVVSKV